MIRNNLRCLTIVQRLPSILHNGLCTSHAFLTLNCQCRRKHIEKEPQSVALAGCKSWYRNEDMAGFLLNRSFEGAFPCFRLEDYDEEDDKDYDHE
jgi:hypothetical protein